MVHLWTRVYNGRDGGLSEKLARTPSSAMILPKTILHHYVPDEMEYDESRPCMQGSMAWIIPAKDKSKQYCIKVLRQSAAQKIHEDIRALNQHAYLATFVNASAGKFLRVLAQNLLLEIDLLREKRMGQKVAQAIACLERVDALSYQSRWCTPDRLVYTYADGISLATHVPDEPSVSEQILRVHFHLLWNWNMVQTDPNLGNFLWRNSTQTLVLIDFGAVVQLDNQSVRLASFLRKAKDNRELLSRGFRNETLCDVIYKHQVLLWCDNPVKLTSTTTTLMDVPDLVMAELVPEFASCLRANIQVMQLLETLNHTICPGPVLRAV